MTVARPASGEDRSYLTQLTSIRGLACMVVLFGHVIQVFRYAPPDHSIFGWARTLVCGLFNAEAAVVLFFVLSGCVLSLSLRRTVRLEAGVVAGFYIKRVFRIYPLLWLSLLLAIPSMLAVRELAVDDVFAGWLARNLRTSISPAHTLLSALGAYTRYNGPMWSLRIELIYSALFPALFVLVRNTGTRWFVLGLFGLLATLPFPTQFGLCFGLSFAVGALIPLLPARPAASHWGWMLLATLTLLYDRLLLGGLHPPERVFDLIETAAAFVVVRDAYGSGRQYRVLMAGPVVRLGELSYSIYLLHLPILLLVFALGLRVARLDQLLSHPSLAQLALGLPTAALTILASACTYSAVELPLHKLGRSIGGRLVQGHRRRPVTVDLPRLPDRAET